MVIWPRIAGFLLTGYLTLGRSFAYLGVPPLFIGEAVLGAFLFFKPRVALGTWVASLLRTSALNALGLSLLVFVAYGFWQVGRGVLSGYSLVDALKCFTFNYYTIYMFMGIWIGLQEPDFLPKMIRLIAWVNGIYGVLFLVALRHVSVFSLSRPVPGQRRASVRAGRTRNAKDGSNARSAAQELVGELALELKKTGEILDEPVPYAKVAARNGALLERAELKADHRSGAIAVAYRVSTAGRSTRSGCTA